MPPLNATSNFQNRLVNLVALSMLTVSAHASAAPKAERWDFWTPSVEQSNVRVDHSAWQQLLSNKVVLGADGSTAVRYDAFDATARQQLQGYLQSLTALDPRTLSRAEQMAYWINLYNALTVRVVLDNPGKNSILRMGGGWLPRGPWDDTVTSIVDQALTLNDIEHRILRPIWQDHRVHFAINCASVGCPSLSTEAYSAATLDSQLNRAQQDYLRHERGLQLSGNKLLLSSIFDWYMDDFATDRKGLLEYLAGVRTDLASQLRSYESNLKYQYDWSLNKASSP